MSRTFKLTLAYDGTDFAGWQLQATDRTVQAVVEDALAPFEGRRVVVTAAGRTDAGVHAHGQVVSFALDAALSVEQLQTALNATLPRDVRVMAAEQAAPAFNARFDAKHKTYRYLIFCNDVVPPLERRQVWHVPTPLVAGAMQDAARMLIGTYDFAAFQAAGGDVVTSVREVLDSRLTVHGDTWVYEITGSGFLRHMVRNIIGTLVDIGRGRWPAEEMRAILESRHRSRAAATAPPQGLTLWRVGY
ncbi:MAG TPA: tRNA pseudouridine(38-40) synthase TruA [Vicinamibacterales bacterium]|nr:tRNA pseudouridine(38-40) synthase TruA [Vicinamibacterales bacterium]